MSSQITEAHCAMLNESGNQLSSKATRVLHLASRKDVERVSHEGIDIAWENIRFSSPFATGDVSRGGTSATQRQKFHTDDVKSVRNPVRSADWSTE